MTSKEEEAINSLANIQDDDTDFHFQPYSSAAFSKPTNNKPTKRPQTVDIKTNRICTTENSFRKENHRQELKKQLKVL